MKDIQSLLNNLTHKGFKPFYFSTTSEAINKVLDIIPQGSTVGIGGSQTITSIGLDVSLRDNNACTIYSHSLISPDKANNLYELSRTSDWYLSSANAITMQGDLVNIDGTANRVSSLIFGARNVLYFLGTNKIVDNLDCAIDRIRNYVAPLNGKRLGRKTPCVSTGKCSLCNSPDCMCNTTVISHHPTKLQQNVYIIIVDQQLGY